MQTTANNLFADLAKLAAAVKAARSRTGNPQIQTQAEQGGVRVGLLVKNDRRVAFNATTPVLSIPAATAHVEGL